MSDGSAGSHDLPFGPRSTSPCMSSAVPEEPDPRHGAAGPALGIAAFVFACCMGRWLAAWPEYPNRSVRFEHEAA